MNSLSSIAKGRLLGSSLLALAIVSSLSSPVKAQGLADHSLVKGSGPAVYYIDGGTRRWITSPAVMQSLHFDFGSVQNVSDTTLSVYPETNKVASPILVQGSGPAIYLVEGGSRRWVKSPTVMENHGFKWDDVLHLTDSQLSNIPEGSVLSK